jgi:hypothetical protein
MRRSLRDRLTVRKFISLLGIRPHLNPLEDPWEARKPLRGCPTARNFIKLMEIRPHLTQFDVPWEFANTALRTLLLGRHLLKRLSGRAAED